MEAYYYSKMTKEQKAAYSLMLQGLNSFAEEFQIPQLESEELYDVFFRLRLDHPEIFWATGFRCRYYPGSPNIIFCPDYLFEKGKIREHRKAMNARVEKLARPAKSLSEWDKENFV